MNVSEALSSPYVDSAYVVYLSTALLFMPSVVLYPEKQEQKLSAKLPSTHPQVSWDKEDSLRMWSTITGY
jgi:hypothetical protein